MPIYVVEIDGKRYDIEGDRPPNEAEARAAISQMSSPKPTTSRDRVMGMLDQMDRRGAELGGEARAHPLATAVQIGLGAVGTPVGMSAVRAMPGAVKAGTGMATEFGRKALGISRLRAAANMQAAQEAAREVPVALERLTPIVNRARELQATGSRMPRVVTQIERRMAESPSGLDFREGSDFVSNLSRMSANEQNAINPTMNRQIIELRNALRQSLTDAAGTVGKAEQYTRGVREYARASSADKAARTAGKVAGGAAAGYLGLGWLKSLLSE